MKMGILRSGVIFAGSLIAVAASADPIQSPIFLVQSTEPLVMINMSNDHELYFKAYDDYSDIDGGGPETTYKHAVDYYGYFDSTTCYSYTSGEFVPQAKSTDKYCNGVTGDWSGNFLNWATMTRMDAIRKTLYGGYRSTDTASQTVLERSFLPTDAHSFAKYYAGSDLPRLTPYSGDLSMCNTTQASTGNSRDVTAPPLMRVATGNFSMWSSHDGVQCQWYDENDTPNTNDPDVTGIDASNDPPDDDDPGTDEYIVRVEVCKSEALVEENCRLYPDGNRKPVGLLQEHGEDGSVHFGLMTGSYAKNKSGGVLRKNVSSFTDEVNEDSDGTFSAAPAGGGIVDTLNRLRLTNYSYDAPRGYNTLDSCTFAQFGFSDGECSNWGNPQSEIYLESLRYLAGKSADFDADDSAYINGLGRASWTDPLSNSNYCAPVSIIHFNASTSSFDGDQLSGFGDLPSSDSPSSSLSLDGFTDAVGRGEGITDAGSYFIGQITGSNDKSCTAKDLDNLSDASGICPEAPWLEGTYQIAGLAYFANQNSIRSDLDDSDGQEADIRVKTYGVALSPAQPIIEVPVPGTTDQKVILLPACMEFRDGGARHNGNCAMVDFRIVQQHTEFDGKGAGKFVVLWESAQFGGDYDHDMAGVISYVIDSTHIEVTTEVYGALTGGIHGFGYVISGTTQDGLHIHSGHNNFDDYADPYNADPTLLVKLDDCTDTPCNSTDGPTSNTYTIGTTGATPLRTPLYYAAKWGGFVEDPSDGDDVDNIPDQDYEWDADADGLPDNYFLARNPGQLSGQLGTVFETIGQTSSASAVVANSVSFQSTTRIYQARFNSFDWSGQLLSFPLQVSDGSVLAPEWDSGCVLTGGACVATGTTETGQDYDTGREILTWDGDADAGVPFRWGNSGGLNAIQKGLLSVGGDATLGENRLNYLRGDDSLERPDGLFRARVSLLGDNVNSSPAFVGVPSFGYVDTLESTATGNSPPNNLYSNFVLANDDVECFDLNGTLRTASWEREPMVYFGANDGMLHGVSACTGEERIAYVPNALMGLLPQLTSPTYSHRYFVDGSPTIVDAFWSSSWHTVLVGTTRAGGKAVFALDVTDPSQFDESNADDIVLWEITNNDTGFTDLGYTFSQPAVVKAKGYDTWVAVFGNGYDSVDGKAVLYVVDIDTGTRQEAIVLDAGPDNGLSTVAPVDSDNNGEVDIIYAGDLKGNLWRIEAGNNGFSNGDSLLYAAKADASTAQPITTRPEVGRHPLKHDGRMVYFGTGKYYEAEDGDPANAVANTMYGIFDDDSGATIPSVTDHTVSNVLQRQVITTLTGQTFGTNTFDIRVLTDQAVTWITEGLNTCGDSNPNADTDNNTDDDYLQCGWYVDLPVTGEKMVSNPLLRGGRLIFVTTIPSTASCDAGGDSWLMEIAADNGGEINHPVFDLNGDGVFDYNDMRTTGDSDDPYQSISGKKSKVGILQPPAIVAGVGGAGTGGYGKAEAKYSSGSKGGQIEVTIEDVGLPSGGRKSWIQFK
jgi:type IV pilus assembly protein PilY1